MQKKNVFLIICVLSVIVFFSGCESEDEGKKPSIASLSAEVDGQALTFQDLAARLYYEQDNHGHYYRSLNINGMINGKDLLISVIGWDLSGHPENGVLVQKYYTPENTSCEEDEQGIKRCDSGSVYYTIVGKTTLDEFSSEEGYVEITSFDFGKQTLSGKFHAKVSNWDEESMIVEGKFDNIPYVNLE